MPLVTFIMNDIQHSNYKHIYKRAPIVRGLGIDMELSWVYLILILVVKVSSRGDECPPCIYNPFQPACKFAVGL